MPRRIAIVEDDATIRANYTDALKRHGYEVAAYAGREEASERRADGQEREPPQSRRARRSAVGYLGRRGKKHPGLRSPA